MYQNFGTGGMDCNQTVSETVWQTPRRYAAGVDNYTIMITHTMLDLKHYELTGGHEKYCLTGDQMEGQLVSLDDKVVYKTFTVNEPMIVTLKELLVASGTDLADLSDFEGNADESMRHSGIRLMVIINYDNTYATYNRLPRFDVRVVRIKQAEYKVQETIYVNDTHYLIRDRHGVHIFFIQGGTVGKFNFQTTLISMVASLGLLGLSTLFVDSLMLYLCKKKESYYGDKFQMTKKYATDPQLNVPLVTSNIRRSVLGNFDDDGDAVQPQNNRSNNIEAK